MSADELSLGADLRRASATHPHDPRLAQLIRRTPAGNGRFAQLAIRTGTDPGVAAT